MVAILPPMEVAKPTEDFPLRYGLFQAGIGPLDFPDIHMRGGGLWWQEAMCGGGSGYEINCIDALADKDFAESGTGTVIGVPFVVKSNFVCAPTEIGRMEALARQKFFSVEQALAEQIFSEGLFAQAPSLSNNPDVVDLSANVPADAIVEVIGNLESWIYCTQQYGPRAVLHVPMQVFNRLKSEHLIEFSEFKWRTPLGTVVSGGCYSGLDPDGDAPDPGTFWVYVTGQTVVWRAGDFEQPPVEGSLNRTTNQWTGLVEREYVVAFECGVAAAPVTLWTVTP